MIWTKKKLKNRDMPTNSTEEDKKKQEHGSDAQPAEGNIDSGASYKQPKTPDMPDYDAITTSYEAKAEAERKADAKRQKRRALFSAIGDGVSSLANIYYATKGAPDMLKGTTSLSAKNQERWDKYVKGRDARLAEYKKVALDKAGKDYEHQYTRWRDEVKDIQEAQKQELNRIESEHKMKIAEAKDARDAEKARLDNLYREGLIDLNYWRTENEKIENKYKDDLAQAQLDTERAKKKSYDALTNQRNATTKKTIKETKYVGRNKNTGGAVSYSIKYDSEGEVEGYTVNGKAATKEEVLKALGIGGESKGSGGSKMSLTKLITEGDEEGQGGWSLSDD